MAEAAGLTLAVVAMTSLFKDCVDLFLYIDSAKNSNREYQVLDTKLDIERTLLVQWAERVKLTSRDYDHRLDDDRTNEAILKVLRSVKELLDNGNQLRTRYGLQPVGDLDVPKSVRLSELRIKPLHPDEPISTKGVLHFIEGFQALDLEDADRRRSKTRMMTKQVRWAIRDKDNFECLIQDLSYFTTKLNDLIPDKYLTMGTMVRSDLQGQRLEKLKLVLDGFKDESAIRSAAIDLVNENCQRRILDQIWFRVMNDRQASVRSPHHGTLEWVLKSTEEARLRARWDNLCEWLQNGTGIYWISGKAGSGKSTLMKHIYAQDKTNDLLRRWAAGGQYRKADFFFWGLGTELQRSQEGLSRALLFWILDSEPALIQEMLPSMWKEAFRSEEATLNPPSKAEMALAFQVFRARQIKCSAKDDRLKYCFFIDGLDEYTGNCLDAIDFIKDLISIPDVKIIASSRPIPSCENEFASGPKLRLQDLTHSDIQKYVETTLGPHLRMGTMYEGDEERASQIIQDIVKKANGVFLWVILACRSVREGLAAHDYLPELRRRVDDLPAELDDLFKQMLGKQEPRYQAQGAKMLSLCYQNQKTTELDGMPTIGLALTDECEFKTESFADCENMDSSEIRAKCQAVEGRIRSRCCGLLEIHRLPAGPREQCWCVRTLHGDAHHDDDVDSTIRFMHRTVFEFLENCSGQRLDCLETRDDTFNAGLVLTWISLHLTKLSLKSFPVRDAQMSDCIRNIFRHSRETPPQFQADLLAIKSQLVDLLNSLIVSYDGSQFFEGQWGVLNVGDTNHPISADRVAEAMGIQQPIAVHDTQDASWIQNLVNDSPLQKELADSVTAVYGEIPHTQNPVEAMSLQNLVNDDPLQTELADSATVVHGGILHTQNPVEAMLLDNEPVGHFARHRVPKRVAAGMEALRVWVRKLHKKGLGK